MTTESTQIKDNVRKAYDNIAPVYLEWTQPTYALRLSYVKRLLAHFPDTKTETEKESQGGGAKTKILELGCGAGVPCTQYLASNDSLEVTANDISSAQISMAKERLPKIQSQSQSQPQSQSQSQSRSQTETKSEIQSRITFIQADMTTLQFNNNHFDAVIALYSIFHLPRDEQSTMFQRINSWLKPGGWLLVNFTTAGFDGLVDPGWLGGTDGKMFWSGWGGEGTRGLLREVGFEVVVDEAVVDVEEGEERREVGFNWVLARKGPGLG